MVIVLHLAGTVAAGMGYMVAPLGTLSGCRRQYENRYRKRRDKLANHSPSSMNFYGLGARETLGDEATDDNRPKVFFEGYKSTRGFV